MAKGYLCIFDVRQVQKYIFSSKKIQEIFGASVLVDSIIPNTFKKCVKESLKEKFVLEWQNKPYKHQEVLDSELRCVELYCGGGNLLAYFRNKEDFYDVAERMAKDIYENTFGLNIVYACVEITDNYQDDYNNLMVKLGKVKGATVPFQGHIALPITDNDKYTGFPLSYYDGDIRVSKNAKQKLRKRDDSFDLDVMCLDNEKSNMAILHIDGNGLGQYICEKLQKKGDSYDNAIKFLREFSANFDSSIKRVIDNVKKSVANLNDMDGKKKYAFREVIVAGDDITFICSSSIAIDCARLIMEQFEKMELDKHDVGKVSACAGIAFVNAKFPFYMGYEIAEMCCARAKARAKSSEFKKKNGDKIKGYLDFEYIKAGQTFSEIHVDNNTIKLHKKPFGVCLKDGEKDIFSIESFDSAYEKIQNISRSWVKELRDLHIENDAQIKDFENRAKSRGKNFDDIVQDGYSTYYDVLDIMDIYTNVLYKEVKKGRQGNGKR